MTLSAETALARITEQLAQRHTTSVPIDTVRRSLRASKTDLARALGELAETGHVNLEADLGMVSLRDDDTFNVGQQLDLPAPVATEADMANAAIPFHGDVLTTVAPVAVDDEGEDPDDEADEDRPGRTIVPAKYRAKYKETRNTCGDDLAYAITDFVNDVSIEKRKDGKGVKQVRSLNTTALAQLAADNGIEPANIRGNNNGQRRMNLSNMLRGMLRKGKDVVVDGTVFKGEAKPKTKKDWIDATMATWFDDEPELTAAHAKARALKEWDAKIAVGYTFNPTTGELTHPE